MKDFLLNKLFCQTCKKVTYRTQKPSSVRSNIQVVDMSAIPKGRSFPQHADEPSFLTTLPPEIRNLSYEILFRKSGPVLLHHKESYYDELSRHGVDLAFIEKLDEDSSFSHGFRMSTPLFRTCR